MGNKVYGIYYYDSELDGDYQGLKHKYLGFFSTKEEAINLIRKFVALRAAGIAHDYMGQPIVIEKEEWEENHEIWSYEGSLGDRSLSIEVFEPTPGPITLFTTSDIGAIAIDENAYNP